MAIDNIPLTVTENTQEIALDIDDTSHPYYVGARAYVTQIPQGAIVTVIDKFGRTEATLLDGNYGNITDIAYDPDTRTIKKVNGVVVSDLVTLSEVAISNDYEDLDNLPALSEVALSNDYEDLDNKPTIPIVNNGLLSIKRNNISLGTFSANTEIDKAINIDVPTTAADVGGVPITRTVNGKPLSDNVVLTASDVNAPTIAEFSTLGSRVDSLAQLQDGSTTGDAELIDGRTGADGVTHTNIGGAVRSQVTDLKNKLDCGEIVEPEEIVFSDTNGYIKTSDGAVNPSASWKRTDYYKIPPKAKGIKFICSKSSNATQIQAVCPLAFYSATDIATYLGGANVIPSSGAGYVERFIPIPSNATYFRTCVLAQYADLFELKYVYNWEYLIDNDDIKVVTRMAVSNHPYGFGPDLMMIRLKRNKFLLGVGNNNINFANPYEATWSAYHWLMNNPDYMFATNCNFSGGETTQAVETGHYAIRYNGVNYPAGEQVPTQRPSFAVDTNAQTFAFYPIGTDLEDIPSNYNYVFACGDKLITNGVGATQFNHDNGDPAPRNVFGWSNDYFYIFFCEGRNDRNAGYKLPDLVDRLLAMGVTNAVNMDGGGSVCVCANMPNTVKINEYTDPIKIRPTSLHMSYKYLGTLGAMPKNASDSILAYVGKVFHPIRADLMRVLGEAGNGTVSYVYNSTGGYYRLELVPNE